MKNRVLWDLQLCSMIEMYGRFRGTYYL